MDVTPAPVKNERLKSDNPFMKSKPVDLIDDEDDIIKTPVQFSVNLSGGVPRKRRSQVYLGYMIKNLIFIKRKWLHLPIRINKKSLDHFPVGQFGKRKRRKLTRMSKFKTSQVPPLILQLHSEQGRKSRGKPDQL